MRFTTDSPQKTKQLGALFARELLSRPPATSGAIVVGLTGDLGSGKTTFIKGLAQGLGIRGAILSPTFIIMRFHPLYHKRFRQFVHMDAYRIKKASDLVPIGFKDLTLHGDHVVVIEWANLIRRALPKDTIHVSFRHGPRSTERSIEIEV